MALMAYHDSTCIFRSIAQCAPYKSFYFQNRAIAKHLKDEYTVVKKAGYSRDLYFKDLRIATGSEHSLVPNTIELRHQDDGSAFVEVPSIRPWRLRLIKANDEDAKKYNLAYSTIVTDFAGAHYLDTSFYALLKQLALDEN